VTDRVTGPQRAGLAGYLEDAALLAGDAAVRDRPTAALAAHRAHLRSWYRDVVGAFVVPPNLVREVLDALDGEDHGMRVVLATGAAGVEAPLAIARQRLARDTILDDSRLELVGLEVPLPHGGLFDVQGVRATTEALIATLDFSAPSRIDLGALATGGEWGLRGDVEAVLQVLAEDAAEELALPPSAPAVLLERASGLGLRMHGSAAAAMDGQTGPVPDAVGRLVGVCVASVTDAVGQLVAAGLLDPSEEG
jgi:hypothetical protein